jgi:competence protein ComEA
MAARILAWRDANGRFTSIDDLRSVSGIGDKTFEGLRELITV